MRYIQPGTDNPVLNPNVGVKPTKIFNPMTISRDGVKEENYTQPDYRVPVVDARVGIVPMFNGIVVGEK